MDFGRATRIHYAQVSIADDLRLLKTLLLIDEGVEVLAAQDVAFLFDSDTTRKSELHRLLFESSVRGFDRDRARTRLGFLCLSRRDRQLHIFSQLEPFR